MNVTWSFPHLLLARSVEAMRTHGAIGHEGLCLWFGREDSGVISVTHLIIPHGSGLVTHPLHLSLSMRAMSRITRLGMDIDRYWAGQIHSHPGTMLDLSDVDRRMGIHSQDYLSLVCPYYAQQDVQKVQQCGVHVYDGGRYRQLSVHEVKQRITASDHELKILHLEVLA